MSGKIILSLAMSLDGYIATKEGAFDWIAGDGDKKLNSSAKWDYAKFLESVDTVVMGKHCYDQGFARDYPNKKIYVATRAKIEDTNNVHFIKGDIVNFVQSEQRSTNANIFIFGGASLAHNFIKANAVDEYIIGIVPIILGAGIRLFQDECAAIKLHLEEIFSEEGVVVLRYTRRNE